MAKVLYSERQAKKYIEFVNRSFSWLYIEKPAFTKYLKSDLNSNKKVLDLGCGEGRTILLLKELGFRDKNIIGVDVSEEMLESAKRKLHGVNFVESDIVKVEFLESSFDVVISNMVFHYLKITELEQVFKKTYSWLKPGGLFIFNTMHPFRYAKYDLDKYFKLDRRKEKTPWGT